MSLMPEEFVGCLPVQWLIHRLAYAKAMQHAVEVTHGAFLEVMLDNQEIGDGDQVMLAQQIGALPNIATVAEFLAAVHCAQVDVTDAGVVFDFQLTWNSPLAAASGAFIPRATAAFIPAGAPGGQYIAGVLQASGAMPVSPSVREVWERTLVGMVCRLVERRR